ncbi:hypothetical protein DINM_004931 [Dirofilaria immitis]|nr:hypothetical protein [Dirofilaria immitis]
MHKQYSSVVLHSGSFLSSSTNDEDTSSQPSELAHMREPNLLFARLPSGNIVVRWYIQQIGARHKFLVGRKSSDETDLRDGRIHFYKIGDRKVVINDDTGNDNDG